MSACTQLWHSHNMYCDHVDGVDVESKCGLQVEPAHADLHAMQFGGIRDAAPESGYAPPCPT